MDPNEGQGVEQVSSEEVITQGQTEDNSSGGTGINPAWNELLENLPSSLHSQVTPHLTKWDQNFQSKIQEVHSQYEPYKRYLESQIAPDDIDYALQVIDRIQNDPASVMKAIQAYMGESGEQGLEDNKDEPPVVDESDLPEWAQSPQWKKMEAMVNQMAQIMVQQRESKIQEEADTQFEADWNAAKEKYGEFDEDFVLAKLLQNENLSVEDAVKSFVDWQQNQEKALLEKIRKPGPPVLGDGGSVPNTQTPPGKLGDKDRRSLVAQMLAQAAQQNQ